MNDNKLDKLAKKLLDNAVEEDVSYINAYITEGVCTTFSTGTSREEVLRCVSHLLAQIVLDSDIEDDQAEEILSMALGYIADTSFAILDDAMSSEETFN